MGGERKLVYRGQKFRIAFARDRSGSSEAEEFFDHLPTGDKAKLMHLFRILCDHGKHSNPEKFGDLGAGLYEFKSFQIRMPYAHSEYENGLIIVTHGFRKKKDRTAPSEIARARRILDEDAAENRTHSNKIHVITGQGSKRGQP